MAKTLTKNQDAHGHLMYDFFKGQEVFEIVERDDGYIQALPMTLYFGEYRKWPRIEREAIRYVRGRVLDVGCGAGRHSLYLQKKRLDVLGIDVSPLAVKVSRLRGLKKTRILSFESVSSKLGVFDTVLMMGNNFGLFQSFRKTRMLLRRLHRMTGEGARIVAEVRDPYKTRDPAHLAYHKRNRRRGRMAGQIRMRVLYRKFATPWFDYLFVSREEMKQILQGTGWKARRFLGRGPGYVAIIEKAA